MKNPWSNFKINIQNEFVFNRENFLRQPTISKTIHPLWPSLHNRYYKDIDWTDENCVRAKDSNVGNPWTQTDGYSLSALQNIYHHQMINRKFDTKEQEFDTIVELGCGYGSHCLFMNNVGFGGRYTMIDFDIMQKMQNYFLRSSGAKNFKMKPLADSSFETSGKSLLIACFSLDEMPLVDRKIVENNIDNFDNLFIAHGIKFSNIDNAAWFNEFEKRLQDRFDIERFSCRHRPGHRYFLATKKNG